MKGILIVTSKNGEINPKRAKNVIRNRIREASQRNNADFQSEFLSLVDTELKFRLDCQSPRFDAENGLNTITRPCAFLEFDFIEINRPTALGVLTISFKELMTRKLSLGFLEAKLLQVNEEFGLNCFPSQITFKNRRLSSTICVASDSPCTSLQALGLINNLSTQTCDQIRLNFKEDASLSQVVAKQRAIEDIRGLKNRVLSALKTPPESNASDKNLDGQIRLLNKKLSEKQNDEELVKKIRDRDRLAMTKQTLERDEMMKIKEVQEFVKVCETACAVVESLSQNSPNFLKIITNIKTELGYEKATFDAHMPIYAYRSEILEAVKSHDVTILIAETGSGKSTQITKFLIGETNGDQMVGCSQPRKIAASTLAYHVGQSVANHDLVGYNVGVKKKMKTGKTKILYMTESALLKEWRDDPLLEKYSHIVIDEAHERSLGTDLLISILRRTLKRNKERLSSPLKILISSATINPQPFFDYFEDFKVKCIDIPGKIYPIGLRYDNDKLDVGGDFVARSVKKTQEVLLDSKHKNCGILVFLPTPADTDRAKRMLEAKVNERDVQILPLHGQMNVEDQQKIFSPPTSPQRVIFATNIAETSVTIEGITVVIDSGLSKERHFDPSKGTSSLRLGPISKSSARQRMGRAGRTGPGICFRLFRQNDFDEFNDTTTPEVLKLPLELSIIELFSLGITDPNHFDLMDLPPMKTIYKSLKYLQKLGALTIDGETYTLSPLGRKMSLFSIDPRLSKMMVQAAERKSTVLQEVVIVCAMLSNGGNIFFRQGTSEEKSKADIAKLTFSYKGSDVLTMLNVYQSWSELSSDRDKGMWCKNNYINGKSMKAIAQTVVEFKRILKQDFGTNLEQNEVDQEAKTKLISHEIISAFARNLAMYSGHMDQGFISLDSNELVIIHPGSNVSFDEEVPKFVVFDQLLITSRPFMMHIEVVDESHPIVSEFMERILSNEVQSQIVHSSQIGPFGKPVVEKMFKGKLPFCLHWSKHQFSEMASMLGGQSGPTTFVDLIWEQDSGKIELFCHPVLREGLEAALVSRATDAQTEFKRETYSAEVNKDFLILGEGGTVLEPFLPQDFTCIQLFEVLNIEQTKFDTAVSNLPEKPTNIRVSKNGSVFLNFRTPSAAQIALEAMNNPGFLDLSKENIVPMKKLSSAIAFSSTGSLFQLKIEFKRRELRNFAFLKFKSEIEAAECVAAFYQNRLPKLDFKISTSKFEGKSVRVVPLDVGMTKEIVIGDISERIGDMSKMSFDYVRPLDKHFETTPEMKMNLRQSMLSVMQNNFIPSHSFEMIEPIIQDHHQTMTFELNFNSIDAGFKAHQVFNLERPSISDNLKTYRCIGSSYKVLSRRAIPNDVYLLLKPEIEKICDDELELKVTRKGRAKMVILDFEFKTSNLEVLKDKGKKLQHLMEGKVMDNKELLCFDHVFYWNALKELQPDLEVVFRRNFNGNNHQLIIYGSVESQDAAMMKVIGFLDEIQSTSTSIFEEHLRSKTDKKRGLLKKIVERYGPDLKVLQSYEGIKDAKLAVCPTPVLFASGSEAAIQRLKSEYADLLQSLKHYDGPAGEECSICLTEPEREEAWRLQMCGHLICFTCLGLLIRSDKLPYSCAVEDCSHLLSIHDIRIIVDKSEALKEKFIKASLDHFLAQADCQYAYCPTPDCGSIYKKFEEKIETVKVAYQCSGCRTDICTRCQVVYHVGYDCQTYKLLKSEDGSLKMWLKQDPMNRKPCPSCKAGIEKVGGCDHVHCTNCGAHICWRCGERTLSSDRVYDHITYCRGQDW